uniref:ATP synthase F0 subunit 8 n=1 Tax=Plectus sambesii TaxID=2011161 RepID=A0A914VEY2_9BILA
MPELLMYIVCNTIVALIAYFWWNIFVVGRDFSSLPRVCKITTTAVKAGDTSETDSTTINLPTNSAYLKKRL